MRQPMESTQPSFLVHNKHTVPVSYLFLAVPIKFVVGQSLGCIWLYDPKDYSMPGLPGLHHLPEFVQTHVHRVSDAIQPSHLLSPPSPALHLSQYQDLLQWVGSSHQVAKILELQFQHQFSEYSGLISRLIFQDWLVWSPCCPRDSQESSPAPEFEGINSSALKPSLWPNSHIYTWLLEKPYLWLYRPSSAKWCLCVLICCLGLS